MRYVLILIYTLTPVPVLSQADVISHDHKFIAYFLVKLSSVSNATFYGEGGVPPRNEQEQMAFCQSSKLDDLRSFHEKKRAPDAKDSMSDTTFTELMTPPIIGYCNVNTSNECNMTQSACSESKDVYKNKFRQLLAATDPNVGFQVLCQNYMNALTQAHQEATSALEMCRLNQEATNDTTTRSKARPAPVPNDRWCVGSCGQASSTPGVSGQ